jgi:hypothetical protein
MSDAILPASELKTGLIPNDPNRRRLHFGDYVRAGDIVAPSPTDYATGLHFLIWLNAILGCCVASTLAAILKILSNRLMGRDFTATDAQVLAWYQTQNPGADPKHPGVHDNGMNIQVFLEYLRNRPLPNGDVIRAFMDIDYHNIPLLRKAIAIGGVIWTGVTITEANRQQWDAGKPFDYVKGSPIDGGHSLVLVGETGTAATDFRLVTWAAERNATDNYDTHQFGEAWFIVTDSMLKNRRFVDGMDLATFAADFEAITGEPFPVPIAPVPPVKPAVNALVAIGTATITEPLSGVQVKSVVTGHGRNPSQTTYRAVSGSVKDLIPGEGGKGQDALLVVDRGEFCYLLARNCTFQPD